MSTYNPGPGGGPPPPNVTGKAPASGPFVGIKPPIIVKRGVPPTVAHDFSPSVAATGQHASTHANQVKLATNFLLAAMRGH